MWPTLLPGSTTGTTRNDKICSQYIPITWQVDRKCLLISASTFHKMCADTNAQRDDILDDLYAHGSRELVADNLWPPTTTSAVFVVRRIERIAIVSC